MRQIVGDLFEQDCDAICITTNGFVNQYGENVMGAGVAGAAKSKWPWMPRHLGRLIESGGHSVHLITELYPDIPGPVILPYHVVAFPTKPQKVTNTEDLIPRYKKRYAHYNTVDLPGWMGMSTMDIVINSTLELIELTEEHKWEKVVLPKPGCANGGLSWSKEVRPNLVELLDDRFYIIDRK